MRKEATIEEWGQLYQLGIQFKKLQPWNKIGNDELIAIRFSAEETAYFTIIGNDGYTDGFSMYVGADGLNCFLGLMEGERLGIDEKYLSVEQDCISMFISGKEEVPQEQKDIIRDLGLRFRGEHSWIYFERYEKGYFPYLLNQEEVQICTKYLEKFQDALMTYNQEKVKGFYHENNLYVYGMEDGEWSGRIEKLQADELRIPRLQLADPEQIQMLEKTKETDAVWEVDCSPLYDGMWDESYDKLVWPRLFLVMDHKNDIELSHSIMNPEDGEETVASGVCGLILKMGRPKKIIVPNILIENVLVNICEICKIKLVKGDVSCCENYLDIFDEEFAEFGEKWLMQGLEEMGFDLDQLKKDATQMSQNEFVEKVLGEMTEIFDSEEWNPLDFLEDEYVEHDLKNRKQKVNIVREFFGQSEVEYTFEGCEAVKSIEEEWAYDWEGLLKQSSKQQLLDMAEKMGAAVDKGYSKSRLAETIMGLADRDSSLLLGLLGEGEREMLKELLCDTADMETGWDFEDFPYTEEQVLKLLELGMIDVGYITGGADEILQLKPVEDMARYFINIKQN